MRVEVYAILKEHFEQRFILTSSIDSVAALKRQLIQQQPDAAGILEASRFAVNNEFVTEEYKLNADDTISILPPASGG